MNMRLLLFFFLLFSFSSCCSVKEKKIFIKNKFVRVDKKYGVKKTAFKKYKIINTQLGEIIMDLKIKYSIKITSILFDVEGIVDYPGGKGRKSKYSSTRGGLEGVELYSVVTCQKDDYKIVEMLAVTDSNGEFKVQLDFIKMHGLVIEKKGESPFLFLFNGTDDQFEW